MKISRNTIVLVLLVVFAVVAFLISWRQLHTREANPSSSAQALIENCKNVKIGMRLQDVGDLMKTSGLPKPIDETHRVSAYEPEVKPEGEAIPTIEIYYEGSPSKGDPKKAEWKVTKTVCGEPAK